MLSHLCGRRHAKYYLSSEYYLSSARVVGFALALLLCGALCSATALAQRRRAPGGGPVAVVVDERLAALRAEPRLTAPLRQRLSRGRMVAILGSRRSPDGINFYRVAVTARTRGWLQAESVVAARRAGDDERLLRLIRASPGFDRLARARIFLDTFAASPLRPAVLLLYGDAAEEAAQTLAREAARRLRAEEMTANGAPLHSYFLNYSGLDRYNRQGVRFVYDGATRRLHYDGASWRELLRRYPRSPEAAAARARLAALPVL